jgi:hypothetical protein
MRQPGPAAAGALPFRSRVQAMGLRLDVAANHRTLLALFDAAFGSLPAHRLRTPVPRIAVTLWLEPGASKRYREAPRVRLRARGGEIQGRIDAQNFVSISARRKQVQIRVNRDMLAFPYHLRYELMEFAVYSLLPSVLSLVPLHGAAVAHRGRAVLLTGPAGSGKSTAVIGSALEGLEFLSEDAVFLDPRSQRMTGPANFLHVRTDGLGSVGDPRLRAAIRRAPVIRRRSGARKFEYDLRGSRLKIARRAPRLAAVVALSAQRARGPLLQPLKRAELLAWLRREQPHARAQATWKDFCRAVARLPAYRLMRGATPADTARALRGLLGSRA